METRLIAIGAILICGCMLVTSLIMMKQQRDEMRRARRDSEALTRLPEENRRLYEDNVQLVRRIHILQQQRDEEAERAEMAERHCYALEDELDRFHETLEQAERKASEALHEISSARMQAGKAEETNLKLQREMKAQEELYQALIADQESMIRKLQQKPVRRKPAAIKEQITFDDLLMEEDHERQAE